MMKSYLQDRHLIPKKNLMEIRFEEFEQNTIQELNRIYEALNLPGYDVAKEAFHSYIQLQKDYKTSRIVIINNPGMIVPTGMNAAISKAQGEIIIRVDGHCQVFHAA